MLTIWYPKTCTHTPGSFSGLHRQGSRQLKGARKHLSFKSFVSVAALGQNGVITAAVSLLLILPYLFIQT